MQQNKEVCIERRSELWNGDDVDAFLKIAFGFILKSKCIFNRQFVRVCNESNSGCCEGGLKRVF